jgi:hypothetical protein
VNSGNQRWSRWTFEVASAGLKSPTFLQVQFEAARFGRQVFGSASQMLVEAVTTRTWRVTVRTEGHPVHDAAYVTAIRRLWARWAWEGFGAGTIVQLTTKLEAGTRQDGTPADQIILAPAISMWDDLDVSTVVH